MSKQCAIRHYAYIDAFASVGTLKSKISGDKIDGSSLLALKVQPGFTHYHLIEIDTERAKQLRKLIKDRSDVTIYKGDCNSIYYLFFKSHNQVGARIAPPGIVFKFSPSDLNVSFR